MEFRYECRVKLFFGEADEAKGTLNALLPDLKLGHNRRSETSIKVNKAVLSLYIRARDAVALRASVNSCLKLIGLVQKTLEVG
jgi:tRNA threonylcarbamoyladenosine modification (KEOPS) complex  Pcc1 subunit